MSCIGPTVGLSIAPMLHHHPIPRDSLGCMMMMTKHPSYLPFEFMSCGGLLISNNNRANHWLLRDGENCLLAPASAPAIADCLA